MGASASERYHRTQLHPTPSFATYHDMRMPIKYTYNFPAASKQQNTNIQIHINTHTQTRTNTYKYIQIIQIHTKPYEKHTKHTNTYKYIQTYTCIHKHTDLHAYIAAYLHIHTCYSYFTCKCNIYIFIQYRIEYAITKLCPVGVSYYTRRTTRGSRRGASMRQLASFQWNHPAGMSQIHLGVSINGGTP